MHFDQSEYHFGTSLIHFGVVIFRTYFILYSVILYPFRHGVCSIPGSIYSVVLSTPVNSLLQPKVMARRTSETVHVDLARCTDLHALLMNNLEHRVLRIEPINTAVQRCARKSAEFASR